MRDILPSVAAKKRAAPKKRVTSVIAYDGDALRTGEMDVRDLAPALLGFGDLVRDANSRLNGGRAEVSVRVTSRFRRGSFGIKIALVQTLVQQAKTLFDGGSFYDAAMIAKLLGLTYYAEKPKEFITNIFELLKFLGGEDAKKKEDLNGGTVRITNKRGETTIVNNGTLVLVEDNSIRNDVRRVLAPLSIHGVDRFETRDGGEAVETVTRADLPAVTPPLPLASVDTSMQASTSALETRSVGFFQIVSPVFKEKNKWRFAVGEGEVRAEIVDSSFLTKIHRHEQLFGEGDILKAEYVTTTMRQGGKLEAETKLLHVIEVIPPDGGNEQTELPRK